ncbi:Fur family transcriptional regulator [Trichothermofontia sp.]
MRARRTRSQERILTLLKQTPQSLSAQEIYVELHRRKQELGLATIYRALDALKREGAVQVRALANGEAAYSLIHADRHHLTCLQCGNSIPIDECPVHELEAQLNRSHHFKIFFHTLEFFGLCDRCQAQATP